MSETVWFFSYKLVPGASVSDFLSASQKAHDEVISKQKGFISWKVLLDGDTWVDSISWETAEDAKNAETAGADEPAAHEFYSYIDMSTCINSIYSAVKSY